VVNELIAGYHCALWNIQNHDSWRNTNNMLRFASRQLAADYTHEFEQMFGGRFGASKTSATPYPQGLWVVVRFSLLSNRATSHSPHKIGNV
jgi:hypothetical protein